MEKKKGKQMLQVLAKPISYALIVDARQADAFLKHKPNPAMKERILRDAKRLEEQMKPHEAEQPVRESDCNRIACESWKRK